VIRALEVTRLTGKPFSQESKQESLDPLYNVINIGLTMNREELYERINHRVDLMIEKGLIEEAEDLFKKGLKGTQSGRAIGYKELFSFFEGNISKEESIQQIKQHSRQFAKRQLTWLRHQMPVVWFEISAAEGNFSKKVEEIIHYIAGMFDIKSNY
jgi:tRNA dimethylallyltransferase